MAAYWYAGSLMQTWIVEKRSKAFKLSKVGVTNHFHIDGLSEVRSFDLSGFNM